MCHKISEIYRMWGMTLIGRIVENPIEMFSAFWVKFRRFCGALRRCSFKLSMPVVTDQLPRNVFSPSTEFCRRPMLAHWGSKCTPFDKSVLLPRCEKLLLRTSISPCVMSALRPVMESWFQYLLSIRIMKLSVMQHCWLYTHSCGSGSLSKTWVLIGSNLFKRFLKIGFVICRYSVGLGSA